MSAVLYDTCVLKAIHCAANTVHCTRKKLQKYISMQYKYKAQVNSLSKALY